MEATSNSGVLNHHESQLRKQEEEEETQSPNGTISSPSQNPNQKQQEACEGTISSPSPLPTLDKERYLCISDGFVIRLLDLWESKINQSNCGFNHLPEISTLNLLEKGLPILGCLFKLGSDVHMIGGRKFPTFDNPNHWGMNIFGSLSMENGLQGSSLVTYVLSLVGGNLSMSESNLIKPLNEPKGWPKVEKMGGKLHVMECFPGNVFSSYHTPTPTHEALDLNDLGGAWDQIKQLDTSNGVGVRIGTHMVVGDLIHALPQSHCDYHLLVFDAITKAWGVNTKTVIAKGNDPFSICHVAEISEFGRGRCVGRFLRGELSDSLHMVFAVVEHELCVHAVVYLVSINGQILCFQRLPHFFEGFVGLASVMDSMVIEVDEEEKTMCAIIDGKPAVGNLASGGGLFVYTFTVEELPGARSWIRGLWKTRVLDEKVDEKEFVKVVVKDRYVYKMDADAEIGGDRVTRMQACFL